MHGSHGMLRKTCPFEESSRTPFIISGGQPRYASRKNGRLPVLSHHVDIAPTGLNALAEQRPQPLRDCEAGVDEGHMISSRLRYVREYRR